MLNGFMAGVLGACLSIGGGIVLVPLWFKAGVDRNVATSSTGPLIFFSSSISFLISAMLGKYDSFVLIVLFLAVSFTGSYLIKSKSRIMQIYWHTWSKSTILSLWCWYYFYLWWDCPLLRCFHHNTKNTYRILKDSWNLEISVDIIYKFFIKSHTVLWSFAQKELKLRLVLSLVLDLSYYIFLITNTP